jgi:exodeoxyribonuclease V alpha subunit
MSTELHPAEVAFATMLARRTGPTDPDLLAAASAACAAPREGHLCALPAPELLPRLAAWAAVGEGGRATPLVLDGGRLYLHRYWDYEVRLARAIRDRLAGGRFAVITGGPGTGKTTRIRDLVRSLPAGTRVLLLAPTGRAAARLREAVGAGEPGTIHAALGVRHGNLVRFRHDASDPLVADLVIVDEASMVDAALMTKLIEAVNPAARLILVGDRHQLTSIEAGSVLGDICLAGGEHITELTHNWRSGDRPGITALSAAIQAGDADAALATLRAGHPDLALVRDLEPARDEIVAGYSPMVTAALAGDGPAAFAALDRLRVLCAHRRGERGVEGVVATVTTWLAKENPASRPRGTSYAGRAILVTASDKSARLANGDTGVLVRAEDEVRAVFAAGTHAPSRLPAHETALAMTIHKSQGSQYETVVVVLPDDDSPILSRELLYTAVTRASHRVVVVAPDAVVRAAVARPVARRSGLRERLLGLSGNGETQ